MNENVQKALIIGASIMITIGIISMGLFLFSKGNGLVKVSSNNVSDLTQEVSNKKFVGVDNTIVTGSDVINSIRMYTKENIKVTVKTLANTTAVSYTTASYNITSAEDKDYINPNGKFESKLQTNANDIVNEIIFTQK